MHFLSPSIYFLSSLGHFKIPFPPTFFASSQASPALHHLHHLIQNSSVAFLNLEQRSATEALLPTGRCFENLSDIFGCHNDLGYHGWVETRGARHLEIHRTSPSNQDFQMSHLTFMQAKNMLTIIRE